MTLHGWGHLFSEGELTVTSNQTTGMNLRRKVLRYFLVDGREQQLALYNAGIYVCVCEKKIYIYIYIHICVYVKMYSRYTDESPGRFGDTRFQHPCSAFMLSQTEHQMYICCASVSLI